RRKSPLGPERTLPHPQVLDIAHLRTYTQNSAALEAELLSLFSDQLPVLIGQIKAGAVERDWKLALHTLKGSAGAVGWALLGKSAVRLENVGFSAADRVKSRLITRLEAAAGRFEAEVRKLGP